MRTTKVLVRTAAATATVLGAAAALAPETPVGRATRRVTKRLSRDVRYAVASAPGILYHLAGRRPDPDVPDDVLADRVRSSIGPLRRRLDVPHVHVMVDGHVAILHGEVPNHFDALRIESEVLRVSGVRGVESHLHIGLLASDTRPSEGRAARLPSDAYCALIDAARGAGAESAERAVHAVLCAFADRIPPDELAHVIDHLPEDVRRMLSGPRRIEAPVAKLRSVDQLVAAVVAEGGIVPAVAEPVTRAVVSQLRVLVPEEAQDVAAVLPGPLRGLWESVPAR
jgi:uncharacterized protein (DUF2267 family)